MRVGGRAEWLLEPRTPEELREAWTLAHAEGHVARVLGGGANLLVEDGLLPGVVIGTDRLLRVFRPQPDAGGELDQAPDPSIALDRERDPRLVAWCGVSMPSLVSRASELGWSGLEGLSGVPGHLGGGLAMNAGGRRGELWDVVESVRLLDPDGSVHDLARADCSPRYRDGNLGERLVVGAVLRLTVDHPDEVRARAREYLAEKSRVQPTWQRSCGCIFTNPDPELSAGRSAGQLIDECGGKSLSRGDAVVSPLHANFIVNRGHATAADVLTLIEDLRDLVAQRTGIRLRTEAKVWRC